MSKIGFPSLPSGTTVENLLNLINIIKKNNKEESIKGLFKLSETVFNRTKSALKSYGIIESDSLSLTVIGREVAFSAEDSKKEEMRRIVKCYEPYELVLKSVEISRSDIKVTDIDTIKNLWGRSAYGSGDRNRNEGATLFMSVIDYIGFGKYIIGRSNNPTRIEWAPDINDKYRALSQENTGIQQKENTNSRSKDIIEVSEIDTIPVEEEQEKNSSAVNIADERVIKSVNKPVSAVSFPNITINVDMSNWSDEKMKTFFKFAYGKFEEDK